MDYTDRKRNRLNGYDYSDSGYYFITICTKDRIEILWNSGVGDGVLDVPLCCAYDIKKVSLSVVGLVVQKHIRRIGTFYSDIKIRQYVIMPNHIHMIVEILQIVRGGTSRTPSPTNRLIPQFVSTVKRYINKELGYNIFQRSYHDRIIRNRAEYKVFSDYIHNNPLNWEKDCFCDPNAKLKNELLR